jgi:N-acetylneuraminic acid mutarotase
VLGGIADMRAGTRIRHVERLSLAPRAGPSIASFEIPAPLKAKNRQGMFLRGNVLTVFGGNRSLEQHDFEPEDFQDDCYALDLGSFAWTARGNFPERRQTIATAFSSDGKSGLAIGGFGHDGENAVARSAGFRYSFADDAWKRDEHLDLPLPRTQFGLATIKSTLWLFGGLDYDPMRGDDAFVHPTAVLSLDLASENAAFAPSGIEMPGARRAFACATLGERAYLVGGMRGNFELVEDCVAFDAGTRRFTPIAAPKRTRLSGELVALGQRLYLCGGSSRNADGKLGPDPTIEEYDPATDRWTVVVDALPAPMKHMRAFALRDRLLLASANVDGVRALRLCLIRP